MTRTSALLAGAAAFVAAGVLAEATFRPESQLFGRTLVAGHDPSEVLLTFDDGPNEPATTELLELLDRHSAKATFFMIGRFARQRPDLVRAVHAAGHTVGNHTETHPWLPFLPSWQIREELRACNETLQNTLGAPVRFFRPPHGARRPTVLHAAAELELTTVQWNVMGGDWKPIGIQGVLGNIRRGMERARRRGQGANIVLHDGWDVQFGADRRTTVATVAVLLQQLAAESKRLVRLDDVTGRECLLSRSTAALRS